MRDKIYFFIDSSVYISSGFNFETGSLSFVQEYCEAGIVQLLINDIVINEVIVHIRDDIGKALATINTSLKNFSLNGLRQSNQLELLDTSSLVEWSNEKWKSFLNLCKAQKLDVTNINLEKILDDYFNASPPFEHKKEKKHEFPDAITIDSIQVWAKSENRNVAVVSRDKIWGEVFSKTQNICHFSDLSKALDYISSTTNGIRYREIKEVLPSYYTEIELWLVQFLIKEQQLIMDFEFHDIEEVYFRRLQFQGFEIEHIQDGNASCTLECLADTVVDYDNFVFLSAKDYKYYSHDSYRELHRIKILINISLLYKAGKWFIEKKSITNFPTICEKTKLQDLPFWCADCEERLYSENETDGEKCKKCTLDQETLV